MPRKMDDIEIDQLFVNGQLIDLLPVLNIPTIQLNIATLQSDIATIKEIMIVEDEKPNGTDGGASIAGTQTRVLNTIRVNTITGASLAANQISLPIGTYRIFGSAPARACDRHKAYIYNVTGAAIAILGSNEFINSASDSTMTRSVFSGRIILVAPSVLELRHFTQIVVASNGLGLSTSAGIPELYSQVTIIRES